MFPVSTHFPLYIRHCRVHLISRLPTSCLFSAQFCYVVLEYHTLGAHEQQGLWQLSHVCVSVCVRLSVDYYSRATGYDAAYEQ